MFCARLAIAFTVLPVCVAHCLTTDGNDAYACDPDRRWILVIHDPEAK